MSITALYALGSNGSGQLGLGHEEDVSIPTHVQLPPGIAQHQVKQIVAGGNHTLILNEAGDVHASGSNASGRCGFDLSVESSSYFRKVRLSSQSSSSSMYTEMCAATWDASILVTNEGIFTCGAGAKGELGLGSDITSATNPTLIPNFPPENEEVVHIVACMGHVIAVLSDGSAYGWGTGRNGQVGEPHEDSWAPRKIPDIPFKVAGAVCGKDFTCLYSSAEDGQFLMLGPSKRDRYKINQSMPKTISGWKGVGASWGSIFVLMPSGRLSGWGRDDHGQLPPAGMQSIEAMQAGSEHMVALTNDDRVLSWGWGEHGNCGRPVDDRSDVKGRCNTFSIPGRVKAIAAGCATSFIVTKVSG